MCFASKSVLIVGRGVSGLSALNALDRRGAVCSVCDGDGGFDTSVKYDLIVVSPGVPTNAAVFEFAKKAGIEIIGELELGWMLNGDKPVVAVTGTNGKTTVTSLVGNILAGETTVAVCGNIGIPFTQCADEGDYDVAVVETSSFQLETIKAFKPHIACITNIDSDHLDRHGSVENYARTKLNIARNQESGDYLVLSADRIDVRFLEGFNPESRVCYVSLKERVDGAYLCGEDVMCFGEVVCKKSDIPLVGEFNIENVLVAVCICKLLGVPSETIASGIREFETAPHRLKCVRISGGKSYWNDSKGTNISASLMACRAMKGDTLLIMGGSDKGYEYDEFFEKVPPSVKEIVLIGQTADKIAASARRNGFISLKKCGSLEEAVAYADSRSVSNVLLSPASASFDSFTDYKQRGEAFISAVERLKE